jgi:4-hydroxybenzoate polyprenyltransferase
MNGSAYIRLMRLDKPIGILLLWFPTAYALWIANHGQPPLELMVYFLMGTIVMRSAGCVVNDLADRHVDKHVKRTAARPLTTGEITVPRALIFLSVLLGIALYILMKLPSKCFYIAVVGLTITCIYPLCKRWIQTPQLVLSLAFSVSIPMVYAASSVPFNADMLLLILINILWVIAYDTMYAMVDKQDDIKIGVHSTAILFGSYDRLIIGTLQGVMHLLWLPIILSRQHNLVAFLGYVVAVLIIIYQQYLIASRQPEACFRAFLWSAAYGVLMWLSVICLV